MLVCFNITLSSQFLPAGAGACLERLVRVCLLRTKVTVTCAAARKAKDVHADIHSKRSDMCDSAPSQQQEDQQLV